MPLVIAASIFMTTPAHAIFGDSFVLIPYLVKMLAEDYKRFVQLQQMIQNGQAQVDFLRFVNAGIDSITGLMATLPVKDEQLLGDLRDFQRALATVNDLYGAIPISGESRMQSIHDQTVAESFRITNSVKEYALAQEGNANRAFQLANTMSPKGAERLNAATNAQVLHTMTQLLRVNAELLKMQGEQFALANKQDKDSVAHFNKVGRDVRSSLGGFKGNFAYPRFSDEAH
jgi:hypothetical protein